MLKPFAEVIYSLSRWGGGEFGILQYFNALERKSRKSAYKSM